MSQTKERKTITADIKRAGDAGEFEAVIATLGVVDSDGDVIEAGAMTQNGSVPILPSHDQGSVPLGKVRIEERGEEVVAVGKFNLEVSPARDWHAAIKFDLENGPAVQEYSWGFYPTKFRFEERDSETVRIIESVDMLEVSPVLRGASVGTRTISAKHRQDPAGEEERDEEPAEQVRDPDGAAADKLTLVDEVRSARAATGAATAQVSALAEFRAQKGKRIGDEILQEMVLLGAEASELLKVCQAIGSIAAEQTAKKMDAKARALADYMAHRARWDR